MKKLYQGKGRRVHPAPAAAAAADAAALVLPAAVLALFAALTAEEQEVLAYLLSGGAAGGGGAPPRRRRHGPHPPEMGCGCFGCYKSFWARWDASPNRHLIHRIIDAVEEEGGGGGGGAGPPRRHHRRRRRGRGPGVAGCKDAPGSAEAEVSVDHHQGCAFDGLEDGDYEGDGDDEVGEADSIYGDEDDELMIDETDCSNGAGTTTEKSTVGRFVRFIGEKVWGPWN